MGLDDLVVLYSHCKQMLSKNSADAAELQITVPAGVLSTGTENQWNIVLRAGVGVVHWLLHFA